MVKKIRVIILLIIAFILGIFTPFPTVNKTTRGQSTEASATEQSTYTLLAKRILIEDPNEPIIAFSPLRTQINQYFIDKKLSGSLYFEYLPTGTSIRVGTDERRVAASLIKLPFAMEAYYAKEKGLVDFNAEYTLTSDMLNDDFGELYKRGVGARLTLKEALESMLIDSDNTALNVVAKAVEGVVKPEEGPFNFLDAEFVQNEDLTVSLTPRAYSSFLKCLYFSCYLDKPDSQEILRLLTESHLKDRLPAGIPEGVMIANKVGNFYDNVQSDCGIVYIPKRNYLICVMLDGPDNEETSQYIADLSKFAYDYVTNY